MPPFFSGAGFYVTVGDTTGTLPKNSLVRADGRNHVRVICASGTLSPSAENSQTIIGVDDTEITSVSGDSFTANEDPGFIRLDTRNLMSDEQGVYTCRIPDEEDNLVEVNIGIYSNGFNSECLQQMHTFWNTYSCTLWDKRLLVYSYVLLWIDNVFKCPCLPYPSRSTHHYGSDL